MTPFGNSVFTSILLKFRPQGVRITGSRRMRFQARKMSRSKLRNTLNWGIHLIWRTKDWLNKMFISDNWLIVCIWLSSNIYDIFCTDINIRVLWVYLLIIHLFYVRHLLRWFLIKETTLQQKLRFCLFVKSSKTSV